ncbi:hypothetical protein K1719_030130 [Acacia pycnantha]|nr:hypothetical protein K1719_030130 [Acacia pycnantha]
MTSSAPHLVRYCLLLLHSTLKFNSAVLIVYHVDSLDLNKNAKTMELFLQLKFDLWSHGYGEFIQPPQMITPDSISTFGSCNVSLLKRWYSEEVVQKIISTSTSIYQHQDSIIWKGNSEGVYRVKDGYNISVSMDTSADSQTSLT